MQTRGRKGAPQWPHVGETIETRDTEAALLTNKSARGTRGSQHGEAAPRLPWLVTITCCFDVFLFHTTAGGLSALAFDLLRLTSFPVFLGFPLLQW